MTTETEISRPTAIVDALLIVYTTGWDRWPNGQWHRTGQAAYCGTPPVLPQD